VGATRAVQDILPSRHDPLAVRHADRTVDCRIVGVQHKRDKHNGLGARGLSQKFFIQKQIENSDLLLFFFLISDLPHPSHGMADITNFQR